MTEEDDLRLLRELLNAPPFTTQPSTTNDWLVSVLRALADLLSAEAFVFGLIAVIVAVLATIIFLLVRNLRNTVVASASDSQTHDDSLPATSARALSNAQKHAEGGDYRSAMRQLYLATLLLLDERGALRFDRALTNRETLRALNASPRLAQALTPVVEVYDHVWYGYAQVSPSEFERYRAAIESVRSLGTAESNA
jgi:hypothetical protein